jgi:hypothetical protein
VRNRPHRGRFRGGGEGAGCAPSCRWATQPTVRTSAISARLVPRLRRLEKPRGQVLGLIGTSGNSHRTLCAPASEAPLGRRLWPLKANVRIWLSRAKFYGDGGNRTHATFQSSRSATSLGQGSSPTKPSTVSIIALLVAILARTAPGADLDSAARATRAEGAGSARSPRHASSSLRRELESYGTDADVRAEPATVQSEIAVAEKAAA